MNDYKKLLKRLKVYGKQYASGETLGRAIVETEDVMFSAASAIETLLAERNAAVECLRGDCDQCVSNYCEPEQCRCDECCFFGCTEDGGCWEWIGPGGGRHGKD